MRLFAASWVEARAVALNVRALAEIADTQRAFDGVAAVYDRTNAENAILSAMRQRTLAAVMRHVPAGARVLDLGCGPGTDDTILARAGYLVTAIDSAAEMVAEAGRQVRRAGVEQRVDVHQLGIHELHRLPPGVYDAALSNFGPLNCVPHLAPIAQQLAQRLSPHGVIVASVIGRLCPWELALHALRRDWPRLRVRFARGSVPVPLNGNTIWTQYYTPREFERVFLDAHFRRVWLRGLGSLVPPPYMDAFAGRHPGLVRVLQRVEDRTAHWPGMRECGDHFLMVLRKSC
jgi:SAM-dependent methyltransferase